MIQLVNDKYDCRYNPEIGNDYLVLIKIINFKHYVSVEKWFEENNIKMIEFHENEFYFKNYEDALLFHLTWN